MKDFKAILLLFVLLFNDTIQLKDESEFISDEVFEQILFESEKEVENEFQSRIEKGKETEMTAGHFRRGQNKE